MSPGKTWEGFVVGFAASVLVSFFALYQDRDEFLKIWEVLVLGAVLAIAGTIGDLFESGGQTRHAGEGHREATRRSRRRARPDHLAAVRLGCLLLHDRGAARMSRVALLGPPGSIGRQALEIIETNRLRARGGGVGVNPIDGLAPLTQVGGDPTELLERAEPDVVLNAGHGLRRASRRPSGRLEQESRSRSRTRRTSCRRHELASAAASAGEGFCCRSTATIGALPMPQGRRAEEARLARPHCVRRAVPAAGRGTISPT